MRTWKQVTSRALCDLRVHARLVKDTKALASPDLSDRKFATLIHLNPIPNRSSKLNDSQSWTFLEFLQLFLCSVSGSYQNQSSFPHTMPQDREESKRVPTLWQTQSSFLLIFRLAGMALITFTAQIPLLDSWFPSGVLRMEGQSCQAIHYQWCWSMVSKRAKLSQRTAEWRSSELGYCPSSYQCELQG